MTVFSSEEQLYSCMRALFGRMEAENPAAAASLLQSRLCYLFRFTAPAAQMGVDARQRPLNITYGPANIKPDMDIAIAADAFHQILLGDLSLTKAVGSKQLKPKGPVWKVTALADLFYQAQQIYPQVAAAHGLG